MAALSRSFFHKDMPSAHNPGSLKRCASPSDDSEPARRIQTPKRAKQFEAVSDEPSPQLHPRIYPFPIAKRALDEQEPAWNPSKRVKHLAVPTIESIPQQLSASSPPPPSSEEEPVIQTQISIPRPIAPAPPAPTQPFQQDWRQASMALIPYKPQTPAPAPFPFPEPQSVDLLQWTVHAPVTMPTDSWSAMRDGHVVMPSALYGGDAHGGQMVLFRRNQFEELLESATDEARNRDTGMSHDDGEIGENESDDADEVSCSNMDLD
ncbi:hypothetical protein BJ741DRAFT_587472 [Chytriomyces cf. hyalinus JEL632]|nr:hypothetical protein BJ741DRAFT_587472 [Chytriomyces cf. hyalinus JEL632]